MASLSAGQIMWLADLGHSNWIHFLYYNRSTSARKCLTIAGFDSIKNEREKKTI
jgi:hypothetical protein